MEPNETSAGASSEQNDATMQNDSNMTAETPSVDVAVGAEAIVASEEIAESAKMPKDDAGGGMMAGGAEPKKNGKGMLIGMILFALLAVGGISFGVWAMMDGNSQKSQVEKQLNAQIDSLKQQNDELTEKLNVAEKNDGDSDAIVNINTNNDYNNPVITSNEPSERYTIHFGATGIALGDGNNKKISISVTDGDISGCQIYHENNLASDCEITGITGKIYKVVHFGEGQALDQSDGIGFIMTDGTVEYFPLVQAMENDDYSIKGKLNINGYVVNAFEIGVSFEISEGAYGGYGSTVFVLRDGSFMKFDKTMLN